MTPRTCSEKGERANAYARRLGADPTNQKLGRACPRVHGGTGQPLLMARSSAHPASIASQRRSPVVIGSARKIDLSSGVSTWPEFDRISRTSRSRSAVVQPSRKPCRIAAAAEGAVIRFRVWTGLADPASTAATIRCIVFASAVLVVRSYADTFVSDVPAARATWRRVRPLDLLRSLSSHPCMARTYRLSVGSSSGGTGRAGILGTAEYTRMGYR